MSELIYSSWWIPCYGLIGAVLTLPWAAGLSKHSGPRPAAYFNLFMTLLAFGHTLFLFRAILGQPVYDVIIPWLKVSGLDLPLILQVSPLSVGAVLLITFLSLVAQCYALGYMEKDWGMARFFALMGFFEGAMCGLALSDSLLLSYALLELLTLSTYLLVGFWYAQPLVITAARDAFWTKRLGDLFLLMGVVALSTLAPSLRFSDLALWADGPAQQLPPLVLTLLGLTLIAGPTGKCAQFPLSLWLDEAMEGPNPASIMRNSVVVATGAYVLIKLEPVLSLSPIVNATLVVIGAITAVGASWVALAQVDMKRSFSHSSSAYLGLVFIAVGMQQIQVALLLLFVHALARSLLFMSVGSVIYTTSCQDLRELGGLWSRMPATTVAYIVAGTGLVGLFPLGSLWAMTAWADSLGDYLPLLIVLLLVNALNAYNLIRIFSIVFLGPSKPKTRRAPEVPWTMAVPMVSMSVVTLLGPWMLAQWQVLPPTLPGSMIPVIASGLAGIGAYFVQQSMFPKVRVWQGIYTFFAQDLYLDKLYRLTLVALIHLGSKVTAWVDRKLIDSVVNLVGLSSLFGGQLLRYTNSGQSQTYVLTIMVGVILVAAMEMMNHSF